MNYPKGSLNQIRLAAKEYEDIFMVCKNQEAINELIILCNPDYNKDNVLKFVNENIPLTVGYEIREISNDTYYNVNALKEAFEKTLNEIFHEKTLELMKAHSLTYGEAYSIVLTHFKEEVIDKGINPFQKNNG